MPKYTSVNLVFEFICCWCESLCLQICSIETHSM